MLRMCCDPRLRLGVHDGQGQEGGQLAEAGGRGGVGRGAVEPLGQQRPDLGMEGEADLNQRVLGR